ncbi:MAG: hypothetical protein WC462_00005 [archaeon]
MKIINFILIVVSLITVLWLLFNIELWSHDWKALFFYQDNWVMFLFLLIIAFAVGMIIKKIFVIEFKALK